MRRSFGAPTRSNPSTEKKHGRHGAKPRLVGLWLAPLPRSNRPRRLGSITECVVRRAGTSQSACTNDGCEPRRGGVCTPEMSPSISGVVQKLAGLTPAGLEGKGRRRKIRWRVLGARRVLGHSRVMLRCSRYGRRIPARRDQKAHCAFASRLCGAGGVEQDSGTFSREKALQETVATQVCQWTSIPSPPVAASIGTLHHAALSTPP